MHLLIHQWFIQELKKKKRNTETMVRFQGETHSWPKTNKQTKNTQVFISHFPKKEKNINDLLISRTFRKTVVDTLYDHFVKVMFWLVLNCFGLWGQPLLHLERERLLVAFRGICCCCYNNDFAGFSFAHPHSSYTFYVMAPLLLWVSVLT